MIINTLRRKSSTLPESRNKRNKDVPDSKAFAKMENFEGEWKDWSFTFKSAVRSSKHDAFDQLNWAEKRRRISSTLANILQATSKKMRTCVHMFVRNSQTVPYQDGARTWVWVDINKGEDNNNMFRSRYVAMENRKMHRRERERGAVCSSASSGSPEAVEQRAQGAQAHVHRHFQSLLQRKQGTHCPDPER